MHQPQHASQPQPQPPQPQQQQQHQQQQKQQHPENLNRYVRRVFDHHKSDENAKKLAIAKVQTLIEKARDLDKLYEWDWDNMDCVNITEPAVVAKTEIQYDQPKQEYGGGGGTQPGNGYHYYDRHNGNKRKRNEDEYNSYTNSSNSYNNNNNNNTSPSFANNKPKKESDFISLLDSSDDENENISYTYGSNTTSNNNMTRKKKKRNQQYMVTKNQGFDASEDVLAKRANRFHEHNTTSNYYDESDNRPSKRGKSSNSSGEYFLAEKYKGATVIKGEKKVYDESDFLKLIVVGTCTALERDYLRLTGEVWRLVAGA